MPKVRNLKIDWIEQLDQNDDISTVNSYAPYFISSFRSLETLDVTIRGYLDNISDFTNALIKHRYSLSTLLIHVTNESVQALVETISTCHKLVALSISMPKDIRWIKRLNNLEYLQLLNPMIRPYLGQPTSYMLEDTMRLRHIVAGFTRIQPRINYIKLESYVFDTRDKTEMAVIREGMTRWFEEQLNSTWLT